MSKTMTPKERVMTAFACQIPDRVPIDYDANSGIDARLKAHFGLKPDDGEGLKNALGVDFEESALATPDADSRGNSRPQRRPGVGNPLSVDGTCERGLLGAGGTAAQGRRRRCRRRVADAVARRLRLLDDRGELQTARALRDSRREPRPRRHHQHGSFFFSMERVMMDMITDEPSFSILTERRHEVQLEVTRRTLAAAKGAVNFMWLGEDLGTQIAPMISLDLFRRQIRPRMQKFVELASAYNLPVMVHTCGSSSWAYEDFIEMGIKVVDNLCSPRPRTWSPASLEGRVSVASRLSRVYFHGRPGGLRVRRGYDQLCAENPGHNDAVGRVLPFSDALVARQFADRERRGDVRGGEGVWEVPRGRVWGLGCGVWGVGWDPASGT